ncbi:Radical SAM superfamily protein [Candidatus Burarchaeum australiense]|nr:Radical SAM superfamily protein [Candidatus Burarchaeum australiense]
MAQDERTAILISAPLVEPKAEWFSEEHSERLGRLDAATTEYSARTLYAPIPAGELLHADNITLINSALLRFGAMLEKEGMGTAYYKGAKDEIMHQLDASFASGAPAFIAISLPHLDSQHYVAALAEMCESRWPGVPVIVGGQGARFVERSLMPRAVLVQGSGDLPLYAIANGWQPPAVVKSGAVPSEYRVAFETKYADGIYPDYSLAAPLMTPIARVYFYRGCLLGEYNKPCRMCLVKEDKRWHQEGEPGGILKGIGQMQKLFGTKYAFAADEDFFLNPVATDLLISKFTAWRARPGNENFRFSVQSRILTFIDFCSRHPDHAQLFADAGIIDVHFGAETIDASLREKWWGGKYNNDELMLALNLAKQAGLYTCCYFQIGLPGETPKQMAATAAFIEEHMESGLVTFFNTYYPFAPRENFMAEEIARYGIEWHPYDPVRYCGNLAELPPMRSNSASYAEIAHHMHASMRVMTRILEKRIAGMMAAEGPDAKRKMPKTGPIRT